MFSNNLDIKLNGFIYFTTLIQYNPLRYIFFEIHLFPSQFYATRERNIETKKKLIIYNVCVNWKKKVFDTFSLNLSGFFSVFSHTTSAEGSENKDKKFIHTL